jgi:hypothetical protein
MRAPSSSFFVTREAHLVKRFARPTQDERRFTIDVSRVVAEVVEWQTRTFEGRVAKAVRVQVPPSAPFVDLHRAASLCTIQAIYI